MHCLLLGPRGGCEEASVHRDRIQFLLVLICLGRPICDEKRCSGPLIGSRHDECNRRSNLRDESFKSSFECDSSDVMDRGALSCVHETSRIAQAQLLQC